MDLHIRRVLSALAIVLLLPTAALACPICFDGVESPLLDSARLGVAMLATLTVCVLTVFGAWFRRLARLENNHQLTITNRQ